MKIARSAFYELLRNPTNMGLTKVPEFGEEQEHYVPGLHESIISEDLFHQVQFVLKKIKENSNIPAIKTNLREEYPLRGGFVICPDLCFKKW